MNQEKPNFITRLNYSPRARGILAATVITSLGFVAEGFAATPRAKAIPIPLENHTLDYFGGMAIAALGPTIIPQMTTREQIVSGFLYNTVFEVGQGIQEMLTRTPAGFDPADIVSYGLGAWSWGAVDLAAKALYNSNVPLLNTRGVYRLLRIQDRRLVPPQGRA